MIKKISYCNTNMAQQLADLEKEFKNNKDVSLLSSQVDRCIKILQKLSMNPVTDDEFLDLSLIHI